MKRKGERTAMATDCRRELSRQRPISFSSKLLQVTATAVGLALLWLTRDIWVLIFGSILLAVFLAGLADIVKRYTALSRGWSLSMVLLGLAALAVLSCWFLGLRFLEQLDEMEKSLAQSWERIRVYVEQSAAGPILDSWDWKQEQWARQLFTVATWLSSGAGAIAAAVVILVMGVYLAVNPDVYHEGLLSLIPPDMREHVAQILPKAGCVLWSWLWGRLTSMAIIAATTLVGLWLLGIPLALSLSLIAFAANFIPYLGPISSAVPALLVALTVSPTHVAYVAILYAAIQFLETNFVTPLIAQHAVSLPPAFTLSAQMMAGVLFGLVGVIFATPLSALAVVVVKSLYIEDTLHESTKDLTNAESS
jgi:predicted PurR-regulated permease PerM